MNWKKRMCGGIVSSKFISPTIGMRVKAIKAIDRNPEIIGKIGIIKVSNSYIGILWDEELPFGHDDWTNDGGRRCWNATRNDWNNGALKLL